MKAILYTRPDGGMSVVKLAPMARLCDGFVVSEQLLPRLGGEVKVGDRVLYPTPFGMDQVARELGTQDFEAIYAESEDEFVARIAAKDVPPGLDFQIVDKEGIPADRTFRAAWKEGQGRVEHDMDKCREIQKDRMREARAPKLEQLDVAFIRAQEENNTAAIPDIVAAKTALRDVTDDPAIAAAGTPEELKAVWPAALGAPG